MNKKIEITGELVRFQKEQSWDNFKKKSFIVKVPNQKDSKYDEYFEIEATNNQIPIIEQHKVGSTVNVTAWVGGRLWKDKQGNPVPSKREGQEGNWCVFTTLQMNSIDGATNVKTGAPINDGGSFNTPSEEADDLPF